MSEPLLSDAELSERIANFIEPKPDGRPYLPPHPLMGAPLSNGSCWIYAFKFEVPEVGELTLAEDRGKWQPRDMVNDPAMTVMLLNWLRDHHKVVRLTISGMVYVTVGSEAAPDATSGPTAPIGRAVALAFAKANGIAQ